MFHFYLFSYNTFPYQECNIYVAQIFFLPRKKYILIIQVASLAQLLPLRSPKLAVRWVWTSASSRSPDRVRLSCCSPIPSASAAAPRSRRPQLLLPVRVRFSSSSLVAYVRSHPLHQDCVLLQSQSFWNVLA